MNQGMQRSTSQACKAKNGTAKQWCIKLTGPVLNRLNQDFCLLLPFHFPLRSLESVKTLGAFQQKVYIAAIQRCRYRLGEAFCVNLKQLVKPSTDSVEERIDADPWLRRRALGGERAYAIP